MANKLLARLFLGIGLCFSTNAFAEKSGAFVGIEAANIGIAILKTKDLQTKPKEESKVSVGYDWGIVIGYKQFFNDYIGLRYYARLNNAYFYFSDDKQSETSAFNYNANIDFLFNFIAKENVDFGGFLGVGIGGISYIGKPITISTDTIQTHYTDDTSFNAALNIGLRVNFATIHTIEIVETLRLESHNLFGTTLKPSNGSASIYYPYTTAIRYTISF